MKKALFFGLLISLSFTLFLNENPILVAKSLFENAFATSSAIGYVIFYTTPLIFTGLAVLVSLYAGLFNIGAEGQLHMGAMFMMAIVLSLSTSLPTLPVVMALPIAILAAALGGALWGALAGYLRAYQGSHEVIVTILLNFISYGLLSFTVFHWFKNPESVAPETRSVSDSYQIAKLPFFGESSPANFTFLIALFCVVLVWFLIFKTKWGFQIRLIGSSPEAARRSGVNVKKRLLEALTISGALAGLVSLNDVLGFQYKLKEGFSTGYGFTGIAVALLATKKPWLILVSAFIFASLHKGSLGLELDTQNITRDLAVVMQAIVIFSLAVSTAKKGSRV